MYGRIRDVFRTCERLTGPGMVETLAGLLTGAWSTMAMGNFPYESSYLTGALSDVAVPLPAWPVRVACSHLKEEVHTGTHRHTHTH